MVLKKSILTIQVRQVLKLFLCLLTDERNYIEIFYSVFILKTLGDRFVLYFIFWQEILCEFRSDIKV